MKINWKTEIPKTLEEAAFLYYLAVTRYDEQAFCRIVELNEDDFVSRYAAGATCDMNYWWDNGPIGADFRRHDIHLPPDAADVILRAVWRKVRFGRFVIEETTKPVKDYWRELGCADGVPQLV